MSMVTSDDVPPQLESDAPKIDHETRDAEKKIGNERYRARDFEGAVAAYTRALEADPTSHILYSNRAAAYMGLNKHAEAQEDCAKCVELNPLFTKGHLRLSASLQKEGKLTEALEAAKTGISLSTTESAGVAELQKLVTKLERRLAGGPTKRSNVVPESSSQKIVGANGTPAQETRRFDENGMALVNEYNELAQQVQATDNELKAKTSNLRQLELTEKRVRDLDDVEFKEKTFVTVGRAFFASEPAAIKRDIAQDIEEMRADVESLVKRMKRSQESLEKIKGEIEELIK